MLFTCEGGSCQEQSELDKKEGDFMLEFGMATVKKIV